MIESIFHITRVFYKIAGLLHRYSPSVRREVRGSYIYIIIYIILLMIEFKGIDGAVEQISNVPVNT